ncbi:MAG: DUF5665 domain-containing protein [Candidatus Nomurabacteria bacterium]|jgi:hypothetical protein|nr:DUF5665 domain-containing protein [Candidatus Nomurabacteria bacterium]
MAEMSKKIKNRECDRLFLLNFLRGIFFGAGSVIGGTIVIAVLIWFLSLFTYIPGAVGDFVDAVIKTLNNR